jgi:hypothetical protein
MQATPSMEADFGGGDGDSLARACSQKNIVLSMHLLTKSNHVSKGGLYTRIRGIQLLRCPTREIQEEQI